MSFPNSNKSFADSSGDSSSEDSSGDSSSEDSKNSKKDSKKRRRSKTSSSKKRKTKSKSSSSGSPKEKIAHPIASTVYSGRISLHLVMALKDADTPESTSAAVKELVPYAQPFVLETIKNVLGTHHISTSSDSSSSSSSQVFFTGAPDNTANGGSRLDHLLKLLKALSTPNFVHVPKALTKSKSLETPAKDRPDFLSIEDAKLAAAEESQVILLSDEFQTHLKKNPKATVCIFDDICSSGTTFAAMKIAITEVYPEVKIVSMALHTTKNLDGSALNTMSPAASEAAMQSTFETMFPNVASLRNLKSRDGEQVYLRTLRLSRTQATTLAKEIMHNKRSSYVLRRWADAFFKKGFSGGDDDLIDLPYPHTGSMFSVQYTGISRVTAQGRWNAQDGEGKLIQQLYNLAVSLFPDDKLSWINKVVLNRADILNVAAAGKVDMDTALNFAEGAVCRMCLTMIEFAGLNQLTPGTNQMSWEPHYRRLDSYIHDAMMDGRESSQNGYKESEEGRKWKEEILARPCLAFIAEDERMVDLVQRNIREGAYVNDKPTVGDVRTQMSRFAGLLGGKAVQDSRAAFLLLAPPVQSAMNNANTAELIEHRDALRMPANGRFVRAAGLEASVQGLGRSETRSTAVGAAIEMGWHVQCALRIPDDEEITPEALQASGSVIASEMGLATAVEWQRLVASDAAGTLTPAEQEKFRLWHEASQGAGFANAAEYRSLVVRDAAGTLSTANQEKFTSWRESRIKAGRSGGDNDADLLDAKEVFKTADGPEEKQIAAEKLANAVAYCETRHELRSKSMIETKKVSRELAAKTREKTNFKTLT
jgi:hypothetical protein